MRFTRNVGTLDRVLRLAAGIVLGVAFLAGVVAAPLGWVLGALSVIMLATAALGFCPIYAVLGVRTCPLQRT